MAEANPQEKLLKVPKGERTQRQWDQLHDIWADHITWCKCQVCLEVEEYLNWLHTGGKVHG